MFSMNVYDTIQFNFTHAECDLWFACRCCTQLRIGHGQAATE